MTYDEWYASPEGRKVARDPASGNRQQAAWRAAQEQLRGGAGAERIAAERARQVGAEGYDHEHDDGHISEEIAWAAACYAAPEEIWHDVNNRSAWPWDEEFDKRPDPDCPIPERVRALEKAGALCAAEIDRLMRLQESRDSNLARYEKEQASLDQQEEERHQAAAKRAGLKEADDGE